MDWRAPVPPKCHVESPEKHERRVQTCRYISRGDFEYPASLAIRSIESHD
jgi:hypothetical protein